MTQTRANVNSCPQNGSAVYTDTDCQSTGAAATFIIGSLTHSSLRMAATIQHTPQSKE